MHEPSVPAMRAPPTVRDNPLTRSASGLIGAVFLVVMFAVCIATLPWTGGAVSLVSEDGAAVGTSPRYDQQNRNARQLPPFWVAASGDPADERSAAGRLRLVSRERAFEREASRQEVPVATLRASGWSPSDAEIRAARPRYLMGTDLLGRDLFIRVLAGGGISLGIGLAAAGISVFLGTLYGAIAGAVGGRVDAAMMRVVDVLFGLPYILLVVLLAVAVDAKADDVQAGLIAAATAQVDAFVESGLEALPPEAHEAARPGLLRSARAEFGTGEFAPWMRRMINIVTLLIAIGGVSWLTMARVVRGQVLSLKAQPFMEAARALGVPAHAQFLRHLLPNLLGPVIVYATLTVPQAILQESFLSFLGIGVRPPAPSWGNLAADGLVELNPYKSHWWQLLFPCLLLGMTLLALNFVGEGLREAFDPKRARR